MLHTHTSAFENGKRTLLVLHIYHKDLSCGFDGIPHKLWYVVFFLHNQIVCESTEKMPKNTKTKSNIEQNVRDRMMTIRKKELWKM